MKILVGSKNPIKLESVKEAFSNYFSDVKVVGIPVDAVIPVQPVNQETLDGAMARAQELRTKYTAEADFFVGMESGIQKLYEKWFLLNVTYILNKEGKASTGLCFVCELPQHIVDKLRSGVELGTVIDSIVCDHNVKQKGGTTGYLTKDVQTRKSACANSVVSALVPFINPALYF